TPHTSLHTLLAHSPTALPLLPSTTPPPPPPTPFPYTTLFRSAPRPRRCARCARDQDARDLRWPARRGRSGRSGAARERPLRPRRSEEHTSELQSRSDLVCRLLLEKKKAGERRELCGGTRRDSV